MTFLGILLLLGGIVTCFGNLFIGLVVATVGVIIIGYASNKKESNEKESKAEEAGKEKELWIAKRTADLMQEGKSPSDAKVQAETEYTLKKAKEEETALKDPTSNNTLCKGCNRVIKKTARYCAYCNTLNDDYIAE